eukprot:CAMPEP_0114556628 /NCGR_PEP_ID=MMETSP0114-20121206/9391_1 /TAXON_ID=31324 /ORGANISM="Goniomonas sp, Strain m" /LENGTH=668 /DNA_ID=CAMNT_0001741847 /DNA_START=24 /DNA_END=2030 /DNA_ORIENTATION=+
MRKLFALLLVLASLCLAHAEEPLTIEEADESETAVPDFAAEATDCSGVEDDAPEDDGDEEDKAVGKLEPEHVQLLVDIRRCARAKPCCQKRCNVCQRAHRAVRHAARHCRWSRREIVPKTASCLSIKHLMHRMRLHGGGARVHRGTLKFSPHRRLRIFAVKNQCHWPLRQLVPNTPNCLTTRRLLHRMHLGHGKAYDREERILKLMRMHHLSRRDAIRLIRTLRVKAEKRNARKEARRMRTLVGAVRSVSKGIRAIPSRRWLKKLRDQTANSDDVKNYWVKRILREAAAYKPPRRARAPRPPPRRLVKKMEKKMEKRLEKRDFRKEVRKERKWKIPKNDGAQPPYKWTKTRWSECSKQCGSGTQTRTVACTGKGGEEATASLCKGTMPKSTRVCNTQVCQTTRWMTGPWKKCNKRCGATGTRNVACVTMPDGKEMDDSKCTGKKPHGTGPCGREKCSVADYRTIYRECTGPNWTHCVCPRGFVPLTGGCDAFAWPHRFQYNGWNGHNGWLCGGHGGKKKVHVICARNLGDCKWSTTDGGDWHANRCPTGSTIVSGGCNALQRPWLTRWNMMSHNAWLCGGWRGKKRASALCCKNKNMRPGCKTYSRRFGDWGHMSCPKGMKLVGGGCDSQRPYITRTSRPLNPHTWQCGGWGGSKLISIKCCPEKDDY